MNLKVELNEEQSAAMEILNSGSNVFLSGEAGTGKSFLINQFISNNKDKKIVRCAPTGIAAINIGGATLHRVFHIPIEVQKPESFDGCPSTVLLKADVIIIDEISMCRRDVFEFVINTINNIDDSKQRQVIVVGDFFQLPPVIMPEEEKVISKYWDNTTFGKGYSFTSPLWNEMNFESIILKKVMRQDGKDDFIENLNYIRRGLVRGVDWFNEHASQNRIDDAIFLCGRNEDADRINQETINQLSTESKIYQADIVGEINTSDYMTSDKLELKVGMKVMTIVNNYSEGYQNGSIGTIEDLEEDAVHIKLESGRVVEVCPYKWCITDYKVDGDEIKLEEIGSFCQIPIRVAYAITIHKSQGQTYEAANILPECFDYGQLYVALSRVKDSNCIHFEKKIHKWDLKVSDEVKFFYRRLR